MAKQAQNSNESMNTSNHEDGELKKFKVVPCPIAVPKKRGRPSKVVAEFKKVKVEESAPTLGLIKCNASENENESDQKESSIANIETHQEVKKEQEISLENKIPFSLNSLEPHKSPTFTKLPVFASPPIASVTKVDTPRLLIARKEFAELKEHVGDISQTLKGIANKLDAFLKTYKN